jgi:hypothetical protein
MTKSPILPGEELLNELMELNQENERPLPPEQLIGALLEIDWASDEVRIAMELYEEIIANGFATPRQIDGLCRLVRNALQNELKPFDVLPNIIDSFSPFMRITLGVIALQRPFFSAAICFSISFRVTLHSFR